MSRNGWIALLLSCLTALSAAAQDRGVVVYRDQAGQEVGLYAQSYALLIGVSNYQNGWPPLPGVKGDLAAVKQALERQGFQVRVVEDPADKDALESAYEDFILQHGLVPQNRLLFYFAGHGYTHKPPYAGDDPEEWMGYIVARDAPSPERDFQGFLRHAVSMARFEELAKQIEAKHALFVFDSCFSGTVFALSRARPLSISYKTARPVRQFITSGSADETVPDVSVFRRQFVAGLQGEADGNGDRYVTGAELGEFLQDRVINYTHNAQHPQYGKIRHPGLDKGDFVFALESAPPLPPPPPVRYLGNVQVNVNVPASVYIGGEQRGQAAPGRPLNQTGVRAGRTEVRVQAEGYKAQTRTVRVRRGQWEQLVFDLERAVQMAKLTVRSNVHGDTVYIDGKPAGSTRLDLELAPGTYGVRVEKAGYAPWERPVVLAAGGRETVRAELVREVLPAPPAEVSGAGPPAAVAPPPAATSRPRAGEIWAEPETGMVFVWVPEGCFQMGSEQGEAHERPVHRVCVKGFWLGRHEVTQGQWRRVMGGNPSYFRKGDDHPVEQVSWNDAQAFIGSLNGRGVGGFRLPSEAEWEYACRSGGRAQTYCGGEAVDQLAWYSANSGGSTHAVGGKGANGLGLYDMSGNVWEWVQDCYPDSYGYGGAPDDGSAWEAGDCDRRVFRGGSWNNVPHYVRAAFRGGNPLVYRAYILGFRLARTP